MESLKSHLLILYVNGTSVLKAPYAPEKPSIYKASSKSRLKWNITFCRVINCVILKQNKLGVTHTNTLKMYGRVPQGSILGPALYDVFIVLVFII